MHVKSDWLKPHQLCCGGCIKAVLGHLTGDLTVFPTIGAIADVTYADNGKCFFQKSVINGFKFI